MVGMEKVGVYYRNTQIWKVKYCALMRLRSKYLYIGYRSNILYHNGTYIKVDAIELNVSSGGLSSARILNCCVVKLVVAEPFSV